MPPPPFLFLRHLHQPFYFNKTLFIPIPNPYPILTMHQQQHQQNLLQLNPNALPFHPQIHTNNSPYDQAFRPRRRALPFPNTIEEAEALKTTTVMIRNIPNQFKLDDLLLILDEHCFEINKSADHFSEWSKFDFVYLPMDYRKHAVEKIMSNLGYAFVNFTTPAAAFKFYKQFQGFEWDVTENRKICRINAAYHQGKDVLTRIFSQKVFRCESRKFLPIVFAAGRDGLNRRMVGTHIGKHVCGLPFDTRRNLGIGSRAMLK